MFEVRYTNKNGIQKSKDYSEYFDENISDKEIFSILGRRGLSLTANKRINIMMTQWEVVGYLDTIYYKDEEPRIHLSCKYNNDSLYIIFNPNNISKLLMIEESDARAGLNRVILRMEKLRAVTFEGSSLNLGSEDIFSLIAISIAYGDDFNKLNVNSIPGMLGKIWYSIINKNENLVDLYKGNLKGLKDYLQKYITEY